MWLLFIRGEIMIKAMIVDDESSIRSVLRKALESFGGIEILAEAKDGNEAVELVEKLRPDCVFMDVEMPNCDGVLAARKMLDIIPKLMIVFITAHQQYMPQAFELYAFDYMVKPFKLNRLKETVQRIQTLVENIEPEQSFMFKTRDGNVVLRADEIFIIERESRQTVIITARGKQIVNETLTELSDRLPANIFLRSHKSYIINISHIKSIIPFGRWTYLVKFNIIKEDALLNKEKAKELTQFFET